VIREQKMQINVFFSFNVCLETLIEENQKKKLACDWIAFV
jgi:hypothetical protein